MPPHRLTTSVIVVDADRVLILCDETGGIVRWRLPEGVVREHEALRAAAERGFQAEIGLPVKVGELAFVAELLASSRTPSLHFGFVGRLEAVDTPAPREGSSQSPHVSGVRFVATGELRAHLAHRPLLIALESWLEERTLRYHVFDLDRIPGGLE